MLVRMRTLNMVKFLLPVISLLPIFLFAQTRECPANIDYSEGSLTNWSAYTGNNRNGNGPSAILKNYSSLLSAPEGTIGETRIEEQDLPSVMGIQVINSFNIDPFGGFRTIPNINGYQYTNAVLLGSTAITQGRGGGGGGGYVRGISYKIDVPPGSVTDPYTLTYAYAMVLEDGSHNSNEQSFFSATLSTIAGIIECASPSYFLPTDNNATSGGRGARLDTAAAIANGFSLSSTLSPNPDRDGNYLMDVWTKDWTEVTFDLAPYRGQQVTLTFESDNCIPGGHFAYAYIALRNTCAGLMISGLPEVCTDKQLMYSVPALAEATYEWSVPSDWNILSGLDGNILSVSAGATAGTISVRQRNSCADLQASIDIITLPSTLGGDLTGDNTVCEGVNTSTLVLNNFRGGILNWISTTDGVNYAIVPNPNAQYEARNLNTTRSFRALVQNGPGCNVDTSSAATVTVFNASKGGQITPATIDICLDQDMNKSLSLNNSRGEVLNWQSSTDNNNWMTANPSGGDTSYDIAALSGTTYYRAIVKNGVCPADTSSVTRASMYDVLFPKANLLPEDTLICYASSARLEALIVTGTSYRWSASSTLNANNNRVNIVAPFSVNAIASPLQNSEYVLNINNDGCPNTLERIFSVNVTPAIVLSAGNDTIAVAGQPLQLTASVQNDSVEYRYEWTPATGINNPFTAEPVLRLSGNPEYNRYSVKAISPEGCSANDDINIRVFKTNPDVFVPNVFTPGKTGNAVFRPIAAGISSIRFFRIYNRWGQLVFSTTTTGEGWDGKLNGKPQNTGSYVWMLSAISYTGEQVLKKGTMTLIRSAGY